MVSKSSLLLSLAWFAVHFNKHCEGEKKFVEKSFSIQENEIFFHSHSECQFNWASGRNQEPDRDRPDWKVSRPSRQTYRAACLLCSARWGFVQALRVQWGPGEGKKAHWKLSKNFFELSYFCSRVSQFCVLHRQTANFSRLAQQHAANLSAWMTTWSPAWSITGWFQSS